MASNSAILIPPRPPAATLATTNDIRPIKPPVAVPDPWGWVLWLIGILLVLGLIVTAIILLVARRNNRAFVPPRPPHVRARERIEAALLLLSDPRAFAIAVSDAVRLYLEERFQLRAPERTTEEFLRDLQSTRELTEGQKRSLGEFLEQCDLVKFARVEPPETVLRELAEAALRLVHETQHVPEAPDATLASPPACPPATSDTAPPRA